MRAGRRHWVNPRNRQWSPPDNNLLKADNSGRIELPDLPSNDDWGD